ncbi:UbiA family prenyltransferase [Prosthecobacter sp.]|uniref:UbiA family prenyltransferase n=1 Tax=Prosthecobacter sp. TaxID=1965333 RepID=UPI001D61102A|nr:UbiA family prenyltransferase [Prosthecobacter sp.]MCB1277264.1 UbiA family prenyltransferase [Prosthecobacter sp.]
MRPWLHLARISNLPTVWTNVTAAWLLAGGALADARLCWLILAGSLLYTGGMILNDAADVKFDRAHRKERPIPSGQVSLGAVWGVGVAMLVVGFGIAIFAGANVWITLGLVAAILFYDLYHKPWPGSVVVMGACRMLLYLMAASVLAKTVLPAAIALGCYVVGLSLAARSGGRGPALWLLWAPVLSLLTGPIGRWSWDSALPIAILIVPAVFALLAVSAMIRLRSSRIDAAVGLLLAGIPVVDAMAVLTTQPVLALGFVALAPLLRLWQRWVAAT